MGPLPPTLSASLTRRCCTGPRPADISVVLRHQDRGRVGDPRLVYMEFWRTEEVRDRDCEHELTAVDCALEQPGEPAAGEPAGRRRISCSTWPTSDGR